MPNNNGYENAPATAMVATNCCCCGRPLLDAESVELGIGPVCRVKYGFVGGQVSEDARVEANKLVYQIALDPSAHAAEILRLRELGFTRLADQIAKCAGTTCKVERAASGEFRIYTQKDDQTIATIKSASDQVGGGRRFDWVERCWVLDERAVRAVIPALEQSGLYIARTAEVDAALAAPAPAPAPLPSMAAYSGGVSFGAGPAPACRFSITDDKVSINMPYNAEAVAALKGAATGWRKFDGATKAWIVELSTAAKVAEALRPFFPALAAEMLAIVGPKSVAAPAYQWSVDGDKVSITTPYNPAALEALKGAATGFRKFDRDNKAWIVELSTAAKVAEALRPFFPGLADEMLADVRIAGEGQASKDRAALATAAQVSEGGPGTDVAAKVAALLPAGLVPYPYQVAGVAFAEAAKGRALIGDVMGLGKTVEALLWLALHPELERVLIIVPASLTLNWLREAQKWLPQYTSSVTRNGKDKIQATKIVITSYECATRRKVEWLAWAPEAVIADECHYLKNTTAQRTKAIVGVLARKDKVTGALKPAEPGIATAAKYVLPLSGTPMLNRPIELFTTLHVIAPTTYSNFFGFAKRYAGAEQTQYGWDFSGASNVEELRARLADIMVRREKEQVLTELPPKRRAQVTVALSNVNEYESFEEDMKDRFSNPERKSERYKGDVLVALGKMRMLSGLGKVEAAVEWISNAGKPVVVFCHHVEVIDEISKALTEQEIAWVSVTGDTAIPARQQAVDDFQAGRAMVFLGTYGAAGVGLTLTAASDTLHVERSWTPSGEEQAEDRCHRIGQRESVTSWYMVSEVSIDAKFAALVEAKRATIRSIMDGTRKDDVEESSITRDMAHEIFGKNLVWQ